MDVVDPAVRSRIMAAIKGRNTKPEIALRRAMHARGFRFRLHRPDLPGRPDFTLPKHRAVCFVHGCFWHRHQGCRLASTPSTRTDFWQAKFAANVARDARNEAMILSIGWRLAIIWECAVRLSIEDTSSQLAGWMTVGVHSTLVLEAPDGLAVRARLPDGDQ